MTVKRWRVRTLLGLVVLAALAFKGLRLIQESPFLAAKRYAALHELANRRPPPASAKATFLRALNDADENVREIAGWGLEQLKADDPAYVRFLAERLEKETAKWRQRNRWHSNKVDPTGALIRIKPPAESLAPLLRKAISSPEPFVRLQAATVLVEVAKRGDSPCPALTGLLLARLRDKELVLRARAAEGLALLDADSRKKAVEVLLGQLRQPDPPGQLLAVIGLAHFDSEGRAASKLLVDRLGTGDLKSRRQDVFLLGRLGPLAAESVPAIVREMTSTDAEQSVMFFGDVFHAKDQELYWTGRLDRIADVNPVQTPHTLLDLGAFAIRRIEPEAQRGAVDRLAAMAQGEDRALGMRAVRALGALSTRAESTIPMLLSLAEQKACPQPNEPEFAAEHRFLESLAKICPGDDPRFVALLVRLIQSGDGEKRSAAASQLSVLRPPPPAAIPALIEALQDEVQSVRFSASSALGRYEKSLAACAIPALLEALNDEDQWVRCHAAASLARVGADPKPVVSTALELFGQQNESLRYHAAQVLEALGPAARAAVPALERAQQEEADLVRKAAQKALRAIVPLGPVEAEK